MGTYRFIGIMLLLVLGAGLARAQQGLPRYRDLKVYSSSAVDARDETVITARTEFVNAGTAPLVIKARLNPGKGIGFTGAEFTATLAPGKSGAWTWSFTPPAGVTREILTGVVQVNGRAELARDLFVAVQGPDPADFTSTRIEKITEPARVVATYSPLSRAAVREQARQRAARKPKPLLTLARAGKSGYVIAVEALPAPAAGQDALAFWKGEKLTDPQQELVAAVEDLRRVIKAQSGAELPVAAQSAGPAIRIRLAPVTAKGLQDPYRLRTAGRDVIIEAGSADGLRNGVYGLLTDYLDCHWFQPRQLGEEIAIPKDRAARVPALNEVKGSRWFSTNGATWGYDYLWDRRNRALVNRGRMNFGHSWYGYVNKGEFPYEKFPEYYARDREGKVRIFDNDWSHTNFCSTNPEVIDIVAKKVNAHFAANPDAVVASLDPNDYAPMCLCDRCLALDKSYGQTSEKGDDVADRLLHFSREIHNRLEPRFKDKYLGVLIYGLQMELPKGAKAHDHHAGLICNFPPRYDHSRPWNDPTSEKNRDFMRLVKGWGSQLQQLGYYDYYGHYYYFGPFAVIHKMREDLPAFRELGGTFLILEAQPNFGMQGLNNYIATQLEWDVDANVDLLLEDYFTKYYGPAAGPMRDFWLAAERHFALERPGVMTETRVAIRPEFWAELGSHLDAANKAVANLPAGQQRFADRVQFQRDAFDYARAHTHYSYYFTSLQERFGPPVDHAAAVKYLRDNRARLEVLQKKYPSTDAYWPVMVREYFHLNLDEDIRQHEEAMKK